jgi:hypothetical protein
MADELYLIGRAPIASILLHVRLVLMRSIRVISSRQTLSSDQLVMHL